jgi:dTDP-glucose 4,6-dehydratase
MSVPHFDMPGISQAILVTGGSGFIGSNFIRYLLDTEPDFQVTNLDWLTYAGNLRNNQSVADDSRYEFVRGDIADDETLEAVFGTRRIDSVINFAAETHVDRSILDATPFVRTNVLGTQKLMDASRAHGVSRYIQISTDEVYGSLGEEGRFSETTPIDPTNPYAATKAAADLLVLSYARTHGFPALITRCSNNYGPCQFPEKFIPLMITNALEDRPIPVYGEGLNRREWIYVDDHSRGVRTALERGRPGEVYNVGGGEELANIDLVRTILRLMGKPESLIRFVADRPAHDLRYAMDCSRIEREWDWAAATRFEAGIGETIDWYLENPEWVREVKDESYRTYYEQQYRNRVAPEGV